MFLRSKPLRRALSTKLLVLSLIFVCFLFYFKSSTSVDQNANAINNNNNNNKLVISGKFVSPYQLNTNNNETPSVKNSVWIPDNIKNTNNDSPDGINEFPQIKNEQFEHQIQHDLMKQIPGLGDEGKAAGLTNQALKEIGERQLAKISLNEELSEHLSYNRTLQDARNPLCKNQYFDVNELPTVSVIIIFFNEPYSVLVRTIHSVLNTCDRRLLKEVIIVDDCSKSIELKGKLDYYIQTRFPKDMVKAIRLKNR